MADLAAGLGRGLVAGALGGAAMSVATNTEMRLRGRQPSRVPIRAMQRVLAIRRPGREGERRLSMLGHAATVATLGAARGVIGAAGVREPAASAALFVLAMGPEAVGGPALGGAKPPWRWSPAEAATGVGHHVVFTAVTGAICARLERASRSAG